MRHLFGGCPCCDGQGVTRRGFIAAAVGGAAAAIASPALAQNGEPRVLRVRRQVVGDTFSGVYWRDGRYDREALRQLDTVFRDLSAAELTPMDPRLFDVMSAVARALDSDETYEVVSGYRTPETNARNAGRSRRVSTVSLHMSGMAADCRLPGRQGLGLARVASELQLGGVGLYTRDGFVHLDCGPVRRW
ncbi:DUF882 domain-containing protein [Roseomonas stagni]|uniref:Murein endopeptidase K n=1 Tax=Falsiroseomonas algicola TaxID=2716930 RepID=A0A6M1LVJ5_9PROT|nr:DUF882 domain-containing protein [Falsiroseomonas algicola]NGM24059.1 DUF882 domain-containing protein [Falsiroseomonas algicola]